MSTFRRSLVLFFVFFFAASTGTAAAEARKPASGPRVVAFLHANVIPMDRERVLRDHTVVVADGRIVEVGPTSTVKVPKDALRVDATGRYLLPALCDMHVHLLVEAWKMMLPPDERAEGEKLPYEDLLFPYVANGVTTVQSLAATPEEIGLRGRIERGEMIGPRLILARLIDGPKKAWPPPMSVWVDSPAEAREAVLQAKAQGFDKIKVYSFLSRESYDAIVATAKEVGMDVIGHVPMSVSVEYVLDAGQKMIAHTEEIAKHVDGKYDPEHVEYYASLMAKRGVWLIPTLMTTHTFLDFFDDPDSVFDRPEAKYFRHPMQRGVWTFMTTKLYAPIPAAVRSKLREAFWKFQRPLTKAFSDKGGKLIAGSDTMMIGVYPGFSLHRELRELVDVGLTPYQALRTSTTNPFEYLGEGDKAGTIETGKSSDLLLLDANPLEDVANASRIDGVLIRGRWLGGEEIHARMRALATPPAPANGPVEQP